MEVVLNRLEAAVISLREVESEENKTNFDGLYKNWGKIGSQNERRREILSVQKSNRNTKLDKFRGILDLMQAVEKNEIFMTPNQAQYRPSIYVAGFNKAPTYSKVLMMSEWLIEKPSDFEDEWLIVPCPKGIRTLVVASNGCTRLYTKQGHLILECPTALPGGNRLGPKKNSHCCVLDAFYQKNTRVLYVLDILAWNSQPMTDGELEFRDYWLRSQFYELGDVISRIVNKKNELIFSILPKVSCVPESLNELLQKAHFGDEFTNLDGLLFYHRKAHYVSGETPLVGWLFPFMVPELLGEHIIVNPAYMLQKPLNYTNQAEYVIEFNKMLHKKNSKTRSRRNSIQSNQMDTAEVNQTENKPKKSAPKSRKAKTKTESMEAEAATDSSENPAAESAMEEETPAAIVVKSPATIDTETSTANGKEIGPAMEAETPRAVDTETGGEIDAGMVARSTEAPAVGTETVTATSLETTIGT